MADEDDLKALRQGSRDLVRRDFRDADLSGTDLSDRDFSGAHFERAVLSNANLERSNLVGIQCVHMNAEGARISEADINQTVFVEVNLSNTDLRKSNLSRSHFQRVSFKGADLRGANFKKAVINEGTTFENCIVDETTVFDDASIFRPLARQEAFRFYQVERGVLKRKEAGASESELENVTTSNEFNITLIDRSLDEAIDTLTNLQPDNTAPAHGAIGHNNPPESTPFDRQEYNDIISALREIKNEIRNSPPRPEIINQATLRVEGRVRQALKWMAGKFDRVADKASEELGKSLGDTNRIILIWAACTDQLSQLITMLSKFAH